MKFQIYLGTMLVVLISEKHVESTPNCTLMAEHLKVLDDSSINSKLLYINIEFKNSTELPGSVTEGPIFMPLEWIRVRESQHNAILQLKPNFEILSLNSLAVQTERVDLKVQDTPFGCLESVNVTEYMFIVRTFLFSKLKDETAEICNIGIENRNGYAEFYHTCCEQDSENNITCQRLEKNIWLKTLDIITYVMIFITILYCPLVIPTSLYKYRIPPKKFRYYIDSSKVANWNKDYPSDPTSQNDNQLSTETTPVLDKVQNVETSTKFIDLKIHNDDILSENEAPTSLPRTLYDVFIMCEIRNKPNNKDCCYANVFGSCKPCGSNKHTWYKCLRSCMRIFLALVACTPWILRITVYFIYENDIRLQMYEAASSRNLTVGFRENLTYFLTPMHVLFLACYGILTLDYIVFGFFITEIQSGLHKMAHTCLIGLDNAQKRIVFEWAFRVLTAPLRKYGIFGFFIGPIFWIISVPFVVLVISFHVFPTIHLAFSLTWNFSSFFHRDSDGNKCKTNNCSCIANVSKWLNCEPKKESMGYSNVKTKEEKTKDKAIKLHFQKTDIKHPFLRFLMILIALLTTTSFVILAVECIIFVIEVAVYTMIGLILNSSHAMQYVSVASIGLLYYNTCFNGIKKVYLKYNKFVQDILLKDNKEEVFKVASQSSTQQDNTAFRVKYAKSQDTGAKIINAKKGSFSKKCETNGVVLFLDRYDTLYISKKFFFDVCNIHPQCPGELSDHLLKAFLRFISIVMFLLLVAVIVLAFGDAYSVSISNQLLATIAGGFVPWFLMKSDLLFSKPAEPNFEHLAENLNFRSSFNEKISEHIELWHVELKDDNTSAGEATKTSETDEKSNIIKESLQVLQEIDNRVKRHTGKFNDQINEITCAKEREELLGKLTQIKIQ